MSKEEAKALIAWGKAWWGSVWVGDDAKSRDLIIKHANDQLLPLKVGFYIKRGWQSYDPVVAGGKTYRYSEIAEWAAGQDDGGKSAAAMFLKWMKKSTKLTALPKQLAALALITHFAEVGRGYESALDLLEDWMKEIASGANAKTCAQIWRAYTSYYPPALTYKQDSGMDFE